MRFLARSRVPFPPERVFEWHARPGAFARLQPPWDGTRVISRVGTIRDGDRTVLSVPIGPMQVEWEAEHFGFQEGRQFCDRQVRGPFARWEQIHRFLPDGAGGTIVEDEVDYVLPGGKPGSWLAAALVEERLRALFAHRHATLARELVQHEALGAGEAGAPKLKVVLAGASGLLGSALAAFLSTGGHEVLRLKRRDSRAPVDAMGSSIPWDPEQGVLDPASLEGVDAVVNLAGANVGEGRWTAARKQILRQSRVDTTALLARTMAGLARKPRVFVSASAIGIYGARDEDSIDEGAAPGTGFLAELGQAWEAAAAPAAEAGIRVVHPRFGLVLTPRAGLLARVLPVFRAGLGGRIGTGKQGMSWIAVDDAVYALARLLCDARLAGPVNVTAPEPVSNAVFTRTLAKVLGRPAILPVPVPILRTVLGELGSEAAQGAFVRPQRLLDVGHAFGYAQLEPALRELLGKTPVPPRAMRSVSKKLPSINR